MATLIPIGTGIDWERPADLSDKDVQRRLGPAAIRGFLKICDLWQLRDEDARQLLGGMSNGAFYELKRKTRGAPDQDRLTRISILTGIFKALNILYGKRLADRWVERNQPADWTNRSLEKLESGVHRWEIRPVDTEGYEKAEVTAGGVNTAELSSKSMESKKVAGLYFIGEVVDVTGWLGGFNFQWAWASGAAAGRAV